MSEQPRALFVTDNGHGLGHLTRMMAVAKHAGGRFRPLFLTPSQAFPLVRQAGFVAEYLPAPVGLGWSAYEWEPLLGSRLISLLNHVHPRILVIDHIRPPAVLASIRAASQGIDFVWSRRGMWRPGRNLEAILGSGYFDLIVEPGDIASPIDQGLAGEHRENVTSVAPVILVTPGEQTERGQARRALGIPPDGRAVLIQVTHSEAAKLAALIAAVRDVVKAVAGDEAIHLFAPVHILHRGAFPPVEGVIMRPVYPVAEHLRAFDGVVSTAGYNSFHEVVASGLPAVFVPRDSPTLDDQPRRAEFAELCGRAHFAPSVDDERFHRAVRAMLATDEPGIAAGVTAELGDFNGAAEFADLLAMRCEARARQPFHVGAPQELAAPSTEVLDRFPSGRNLQDEMVRGAERIGIVALGFTDDELADAADQVARKQASGPFFKPVFLVDHVGTEPLIAWGFQFETVMAPDEWTTVGTTGYGDYIRSRLGELREHYQLSRVISLDPGAAITLNGHGE